MTALRDADGTAARTARAALRFPGLAARGLIRLYRYTLSSLVGRTCRHLPTCSEYADEAIARHGLWAGFWIGLARFSRCRPLGTHGFDPVPKRLPERARWFLPWRYGRWRGIDSAEAAADNGRVDTTEARMPRPKADPGEETELVFKQPGEDPEYDAWFLEEVQAGIDEADRGELISDEEMRRWFAERKAELERLIEDQKRN
jgi:putative membrane protein insertion efficiency factor